MFSDSSKLQHQTNDGYDWSLEFCPSQQLHGHVTIVWALGNQFIFMISCSIRTDGHDCHLQPSLLASPKISKEAGREGHKSAINQELPVLSHFSIRERYYNIILNKYAEKIIMALVINIFVGNVISVHIKFCLYFSK